MVKAFWVNLLVVGSAVLPKNMIQYGVMTKEKKWPKSSGRVHHHAHFSLSARTCIVVIKPKGYRSLKTGLPARRERR